MRIYVIVALLFSFSAALSAQIDREQKLKIIPAEKSSEEKSPELIEPAKPINTTPNLNVPQVSRNLELPKEEFSMFPKEKFGNPGELYNKQIEKIEKDLLPEGHGSYAGLKEDAYWGDYHTKSDYILISYRDHGRIDGDLLNVLVDDDVLQSNVYLSGNFNGFKLKLKDGFNKIDFYAVDEGSLLPNTAQYKIVDEWGNVITGKIWALSEGVKVTVIIIKD